MLEPRHFTIFTDHKPITFAFQQKQNKCSPRQINHLDFIAQFTTDARHVSGRDNVVADALSRVESITVPPSHDVLAASQDTDDELRTLLTSNTVLRLEKLHVPVTAVSIYCDTSAGKSRTYVPASLCLQVFQSIHDLSHPATSVEYHSCGFSLACFRAVVAPLKNLKKHFSVRRKSLNKTISSL
jgi:cleavage and polyadenylation specificity factor subunit 1